MAVLADEMGLGKTPQAIAAVDACGYDKVIVVCPAVVRPQWVHEFKKFSDKERHFQIIEESKRLTFAPGTDTIITSYDLLTKPDVLKKLREWRPHVIIFDEAQFLRNPDTKRTRSALGPDCTGKDGLAEVASRVWFLSGTLTPRDVLDFYPFMRFAKAFNADYEAFKRQYTHGYEGTYGYIVTRNINIPDLRTRLSKIMLRRSRSDVKLPVLMPVHVLVEPTESPSADEHVLHELADIDKELKQEFEFFKKHGRLEHPNNVAALRRKVSMMKVLPVCQLIDEELKSSPTTKVAVFGIHVLALKFIRAYLHEYNAKLIFGGTKPSHREVFINQFQTSPTCRVIVGNMAALGVGTNLTAANSVWMFESSWLPDDNDQAMYRGSVRIGVPQMVRFVSLAGTVDEAVNEINVKRAKQIKEIRHGTAIA